MIPGSGKEVGSDQKEISSLLKIKDTVVIST
jgi:hypothetical protein